MAYARQHSRPTSGTLPHSMSVRIIVSEHELSALRPMWNQLAVGQPFRSWDWQVAWWRHYGRGPGRRLHLIACFDGQTLIGLLPCYRRLTPQGRVLRPLASGEVCSEYLGLLAAPGRASEVATQICDALSGTGRQADLSRTWDLLILDAQDAGDEALGLLRKGLALLGHPMETALGAVCWRLVVPDDPDHLRGSAEYEQARFELFLKQVARGHRSRLRRAERRGVAQDYQLHFASDEASLAEGFAILVELHQRRRAHYGQVGVFARRRFLSFHRDATRALLASGQLWLAWMTQRGVPVSAYYCLADGSVLHAYQSGLNPDYLDDEPGRILLLRLLRRALNEGYSALDLLRGDEPYKSHLGAEPQSSLNLMIGNRTLVGRTAFGLAQLRRRTRKLAGQIVRQLRAP